jgi:hypothetical protein
MILIMSLVRSGFTESHNNSQQKTFASWNYMVNIGFIHIDRPLQKLSITNIAFICLRLQVKAATIKGFTSKIPITNVCYK